MHRSLSSDQWVGLFFIIFSFVLVIVWIPFDTDTGFIEVARRQVTLGDSLAPTVAGAIIFLAGLLLLFPRGEKSDFLNSGLIVWIFLLVLILAFWLGIMRYSGPTIAFLITDTDYRTLRDSFPWKYVGFLLGGTGLIFNLICLVEQKLSWRSFIIALAASLAIAFVYDVPFDDLILPPNGDF